MTGPKSAFDPSQGRPSLDALQFLQGNWTPEDIAVAKKETVKCFIKNIPLLSHAAGTPVVITNDDIPFGSEIVRVDQLGGANADVFTVTDGTNTVAVATGTAANTFTVGTLIKARKIMGEELVVTTAAVAETCDLYIYYK